VILAQALYDNAREHGGPPGHLYSVDAVDYWAKTTWELMPKHTQAISTCVATDLVTVEYGGTPVLRHAEIPDVAPDFIFLDGPDFQEQEHKAVCDPVDLESRFRPGFCMVVDGRVENTNFLKAHLKRNYSVSHRWPFEPWETSVFELVA
jgi:hypothetical protein